MALVGSVFFFSRRGGSQGDVCHDEYNRRKSIFRRFDLDLSRNLRRTLVFNDQRHYDDHKYDDMLKGLGVKTPDPVQNVRITKNGSFVPKDAYYPENGTKDDVFGPYFQFYEVYIKNDLSASSVAVGFCWWVAIMTMVWGTVVVPPAAISYSLGRIFMNILRHLRYGKEYLATMRAADLKLLIGSLSMYLPLFVPDFVYEKVQLSPAARDRLAKSMAAWLGGVTCLCPDLKSVHPGNKVEETCHIFQFFGAKMTKINSKFNISCKFLPKST